jgi:hypothetical protein
MKKDNINLILAGAGIVIALAMLPKGKAGDGSESGGFQLPSVFPSGQGAGEAVVPGATTYNISFPEFPGFPSGTTPTATTGYTQADATKKSIAIANIGSGGVPQTLSGLAAQTSPGMFDVSPTTYGTPSAWGKATKKEAVVASTPVTPITPITSTGLVYQAAATKAYGSNVIAQAYGGSGGKSTGGMGRTTGTSTSKKTSTPSVRRTSFTGTTRGW